jgi:hypothetical protein
MAAMLMENNPSKIAHSIVVRFLALFYPARSLHLAQDAGQDFRQFGVAHLLHLLG